jgi:muconolactone delta-isomerase
MADAFTLNPGSIAAIDRRYSDYGLWQVDRKAPRPLLQLLTPMPPRPYTDQAIDQAYRAVQELL